MNSVRLAVKVAPRASRERIIGLAETAQGMALKIAVTAPPEDGRANEAVLRLLAKRLRVPLRAFAVLRGASSRDKLIEISGEPTTLLPLIEEALRPWLKPD